MKVIVGNIICGYLFLVGFNISAQENVQTVGNNPAAISETSGLIYFNESLITINDSGNDAVLFELDTLSLSIKRTVSISNVDNIDWEAISQDDEYIYIGDFGNNVGIRKDLAIHRIAKTDYINFDNVTASTITYSYVDQEDFTNDGYSDWDAEAFFILNDQLIILTKQWQSLGSVAYAIPKTPGDYVASRVGEIENTGLITDATYNLETNKLVVIGYSSILSPFIGIVYDLNSLSIFEGYSQTSLGLNFVQAEGITQVSATNYFFTSEYYSRQSPTIESSSRLFSFQLEANVTVEPEEPGNPENPQEPEEPENPEEPSEPEESETPDSVEEMKDNLIIFKDNTTNEYRYSLTTDKAIYGQIIFDVLGQQVWQNFEAVEMEGSISLNLETSIYYLALYLEDRVIAKPFAVYK